MAYKVNTQKLQDILYIYKNDDEKFETELNIEKYLTSGNIFSHSPHVSDSVSNISISNNESEKLLKKAAYYLANMTEKAISVNMGYPEKGDEPYIVSGKAYLLAAIYAQKETIWVNLQGSEKAIKGLLDIDLNDNDEINHNISQVGALDWKALLSVLDNSLDDDDYLIDKIKNNTDAVASVSAEKWQDIEFIEKLFNENPYLLKFMPDYVKYGDMGLSLIESNEHYLEYNFTDEFLKLYNGVYEPLIEKFKTRLLTMCEKYINEHSNHINNEAVDDSWIDILSVTPESFRLQPHIIDLVVYYANKKEEDGMNPAKFETNHPLRVIPKKYFETKANTIEFIKKYPHLDAIPEQHQYFWNSLLHDKESILLLCEQVIKNSEQKAWFDSDSLLKTIDRQFLADFDILFNIIPLWPKAYHYAPQNLKSDIAIVSQLILHAGNFELSYLDKSVVSMIKDKEVLKSLVSKVPLVLKKDSGYPSSWREDLDILVCAGQKIDELDIEDKLFDKFNERLDLAAKIACYKPLYKRFNEQTQADPIVALNLLNNNFNSDIQSIPARTWINQDFCLSILKDNALEEHASLIPQDFWTDKDFIVKILKKLDTRELNSQVFNYMPSEMGFFFTALQTRPSMYESTFNKYVSSLEFRNKLSEELPKKEDVVKSTPVKKLKI